MEIIFTDSEILEQVSKARSRLLFSQPFFGSLAMYLQISLTSDPRIWIAATDGRYLYINRHTWPTLKLHQQVWVIAHEVMHPALGHVFAWRRGDRDRVRWNKAGDFAINLLLEEVSGLKEGRIENVCYDTKYKDLCAEEIYKILSEEEPICPQCGGTGEVADDSESQGSGSPDDSDSDVGDDSNPSEGESSEEEDKGSDSSGDENSDKEGKGSGSKGSGSKGNKKPCPHCQGNFSGDIVEADYKDGEQEQRESREWARRFINTAKAAMQQGNVPAGIKRLLEGLTHPRLPWYQILSQMVGEIVRDDYQFGPFDRRYLYTGVYLPDIYNEKVYAVIGCDTSGSITDKMMEDFFAEIWGILQARSVSKIRLMACDAEVHFDRVYHQGDVAPKSLPGGGGTDFRPMFKKLDEDTSETPACLIIFTDLDGTFPSTPPQYPVIWVVPESSSKYGTKPEDVPFGQVIVFHDAA